MLSKGVTSSFLGVTDEQSSANGKGMKDACSKRQRTTDRDDRLASTNKRKMPGDVENGKAASGKRQRTYTNDDGKHVATKKRIPSDYKSTTVASRERGSSVASDGLRLVLVPPATPIRQRRRYRRRHLDVRPRNEVSGSANGHACTFCLDSGSSTNAVFFSLAKRLGMVSGEERTETKLFNLWGGRRKLEVITLEEVAVTLGGKVDFRVPFGVLPASLEERYAYLRTVVLLGVPVLRRLNAVQTFGPDGSRLYIRRPRCMKACKRWWRTQWQGRRRMFTFWVRALHGRSRLMTVNVDTGATQFFYVSRGTRVEIMRREAENAKAIVPRRASLDLGCGECLEAALLATGPPQHDFVIGERLLHKYEAVLDYAKYHLTLAVGGRHFRVDLGV